MAHSIKLIYRYLYKNYFLVLFTCLLIIVISIILKFFIQYALNKNNISVIKKILYKKLLSYQILNVCSYNNDANDLVYLDFLEKKLFFKQLWYPICIYKCSVSSSKQRLDEILIECTNSSINSNDIYKLMQQCPQLRYVSSGEAIFWLVLDQKKIHSLIWALSDQEIHIVGDINTIFVKSIVKFFKKSNNELFYTILFIGELNNTFIDSARNLGLEEDCIIDIINALKYQLDFRKLRRGDKFAILVSSYKVHGKNYLKNKLIGARLNSSGKDYYVFRANNGKLYNQDAVRLENNFIRFPLLQPYRISSNFNLNRLNPVTGLISPHAGVDFAVPIGTPVLSIGDGEVIISKYSKVAGNYVCIKHNYQCMTRYMHLNKVLVKPGQRVRQGQQIALSGNTGRTTGPHLHFEVWVNHQPVNPLTTDILKIEKLSGNERIKYLHQINEIIPKLKFN